jgi:DNA-binding PadR family transcriptional regulator
MGARAVGKERVEGPAAAKPMTSPVNWALLGLLMERPGYGSQLRQRFERAYGDVLPLASESHIYTALNELQRRGLIEEVSAKLAAQSGTGRQPKPRYRATAEGTRGYREWMLGQVSADRRAALLFVRQLAVFGRAGEPAVALQILDRFEQACLSETRQLPSTSAQGPLADVAHGTLADVACGLTDRLVAEERRLAVEARLPWVQYARREFKVLERDRGDEPARA